MSRFNLKETFQDYLVPLVCIFLLKVFLFQGDTYSISTEDALSSLRPKYNEMLQSEGSHGIYITAFSLHAFVQTLSLYIYFHTYYQCLLR